MTAHNMMNTHDSTSKAFKVGSGSPVSITPYIKRSSGLSWVARLKAKFRPHLKDADRTTKPRVETQPRPKETPPKPRLPPSSGLRRGGVAAGRRLVRPDASQLHAKGRDLSHHANKSTNEHDQREDNLARQKAWVYNSGFTIFADSASDYEVELETTRELQEERRYSRARADSGYSSTS